MIDADGMCFQWFLWKLPPVPEMRPKVVNFTQELMAGFNRIKWQLLQELVAGLIKNIHNVKKTIQFLTSNQLNHVN